MFMKFLLIASTFVSSYAVAGTYRAEADCNAAKAWLFGERYYSSKECPVELKLTKIGVYQGVIGYMSCGEMEWRVNGELEAEGIYINMNGTIYLLRGIWQCPAFAPVSVRGYTITPRTRSSYTAVIGNHRVILRDRSQR